MTTTTPKPPTTTTPTTAPTTATCAAGEAVFFSGEANSRRSRNPQPRRAQRCAFPTAPAEVVAGVWHCLRCETQLQAVADTWAPRLTTVYLASAKAVAAGSPFLKRHRERVIDTGETEDNYLSTLGKGLVGLRLMHARFPRHKWFGIFGDDLALVSSTKQACVTLSITAVSAPIALLLG